MKKITVIVPSYNNSQWYKKNLDSIFAQNYSNFSVIYIDDKSSDGTADLVEAYIKLNKRENLVKLIKNEVRVGALQNIYDAVHSCDDTDICVLVDGDDFLANPGVLSRVVKEYEEKDIWMTWGSYIDWPSNTRGCAKPYEQHIIDSSTYRYVDWRASHLRSFYAKLFKNIKREDLVHDGKFFQSGWDLALMLPMLELSGSKQSYIHDILYVYNNNNPISDYKIRAQQQAMFDGIIRRQQRYTKLDKLF